jgi:hypothetical protein
LILSKRSASGALPAQANDAQAANQSEQRPQGPIPAVAARSSHPSAGVSGSPLVFQANDEEVPKRATVRLFGLSRKNAKFAQAGFRRFFRRADARQRLRETAKLAASPGLNANSKTGYGSKWFRADKSCKAAREVKIGENR